MKRVLIVILLAISISVSGKEKKTKVVFMGDSITDGNWGGGGGRPSNQRDKNDYNHIYGHGFMEMITGYYMSKYPEKEYEFQNRGISGYRLDNLAEKWQEDVINQKPDILSILIGTNDALSFSNKSSEISEFNFEKWDSTYRALLDDARNTNPNIRIILCSPFTVILEKISTSNVWEERKTLTDKFSSIIQKIAEDYKATYVPFDKLFNDLEGKYDVPDNYWSWDGIHPTTQAHYKMANLWIKKVGKL